MRFTIGNIDLHCFWCTIFWVPDPLPHPFLSSNTCLVPPFISPPPPPGLSSRVGRSGLPSAPLGGAPGPHRNTARQAMDGLWTEVCGQQKQSNDPGNNQHNPQYANYWAPLTRKRHIPPHPAQPQHANHWAPRMRKRHQQEHRPQRPTESSDLTQHAKGRTGDCSGPCKGATTGRNVTQGGAGQLCTSLLGPGEFSPDLLGCTGALRRRKPDVVP